MTATRTAPGWSPVARIVAPAVVLASTLPPLYGLWLNQGTPMEEGFMLVFPELVMEGQVPNRDFLHLYGPGSLWVLAGVFTVFGVSLAAERVVGFLQHLGVMFGVYRLLRPWGPWVAAGGGCLASLLVLTPSGLTALAWVGAVALGLWALSCALDAVDGEADGVPRRWAPVAAGALAGAALLYRLDVVLALTAAAVVVVPALSTAGRRRALVGLLAGGSPYLVHLAMAGPGAAVRGMVIEPIFELRGGRHLPVPPSPDHFDGFLQGAWIYDPPPWPLPAPSGPRQLWLWFFALLAAGLLLLVAGLIAWRRRGDRRLLAMAAFAVGLFPQAVQRPDSTHLAWVGCVAFAFLPAAIVELVRARRARPVPPVGWRTGLPAVGAVAALLLVVAPHWPYRDYAEMTLKTFGHRRFEEVIEHDGRQFPYKRDDAVDAIREMLPVIDATTEPGDRLIVGPGDLRLTPYSEAFLYFLLPDLVPATRYIEMDPGVANAADSDLADEIAAADVVVLSTMFDDWNEPNDSRVPGSDAPNQVLARDFCLEQRFGESAIFEGRGLYELYLRCPRG